MRKAIFLGASLLAVGAFTSCTDEPTPMDKAKENVAGTEWLGYMRQVGYTMKFKKDGTFTVTATNAEECKGNYTQNGTSIKFKRTWSWGGMYDFTEGTISKGGGSMDVPVYYYDGSSAGTIKFTLNVLD